MERPTTLVQYRGGGYSGCFWEWNFAYIDEDLKFHDLLSSGSGALKSMEALKAYIEKGSSIYYYDTSDKEKMLEFANENAGALVVLVADLLCQDFDIEVQFACVGCDTVYDVEPCTMVYLTGKTTSDLYCDECHSLGTYCPLCGTDTDFNPAVLGDSEDLNVCYSCSEAVDTVTNYLTDLDGELQQLGNIREETEEEFLSLFCGKINGDKLIMTLGSQKFTLKDNVLYFQSENERYEKIDDGYSDGLEILLFAMLQIPNYIPKEEDFCGRLI